jgi:tetratricopeptide (TPR) repeat protein
LRERPQEQGRGETAQTAHSLTAAETLVEARRFLETGSPKAIRAALSLIEERDLLQSEYGRMMNAVAALMADRVYPDAGITYGEVNPPLHLPYAKIITEVRNGAWNPPSADSSDYLALTLPCVILVSNTSPDVNNAALPYLRKARRINPKGILAAFLAALALERTGQLLEARQLYDEAVTLSNAECYPAFLGIARILARANRYDDAITLLLELIRLYPENIAARRQLANSYIAAGEWAKAEDVISGVLSRNYRNPEFLLLQARVFIELGRYNQAQLPLDSYESAGGPENSRQYFFLRARLAWEGNRSRSAAVAQLRRTLAIAPDDVAAQIYLTRLLLGSTQPANVTEGRQMLRRLQSRQPVSPEVIHLALQDAIAREAWAEADGYLTEILQDDPPTLSILQSAVMVKNGLGDRPAALGFARKMADAFPGNETALLDLIGMLIQSNVRAERNEGEQMIAAALPALKNVSERSRAYYYRSRLRTNDEDTIADLRTSLLENPRNIDAILGLIAIYEKRKDTRRVTFYLQQAIVLAPNHPEVNRIRLLYEQS